MDSNTKKIRLGLLMDSFMIPAWEHVMLEEILKGGHAEIALVVLNQAGTKKESLWERIWNNRNHLLYRLYTRFDNALARNKPDAFARTDAQKLLAGIPVLQVMPVRKRFSDFIEEQDLAKIRDADLDVLVRMGFRLLRGGILQATRHGIWSYHHGDNRVLRGKPSGFWEVFENMPMSGTVLQVLSDSIDNGLVLSRSYSSTNQFSVRNSRNKYFWKSVSLLPRALRDLHAMGEEAFWGGVSRANQELNFYDRRQYLRPTNGAFLRAFPAHAWRTCKGICRKAFWTEEWKILYHLDPDGKMGTEFRRFKALKPPRSSFWADPFVFVKDGVHYIFFEEWPHDPGTKGHICVTELQGGGTFSAPRKVLEDWYHFAYPFVFEYQGQIYMLPDSAQNGTVDIYRSESFPDSWTLHKTLMSGVHAVDPTLFQHGGKWWLFANIKRHKGASYADELFLFFAETPFSDKWTAHPANPIVSDARKARPAGRILEHQGKIYRVSQDCSRGYGYGINFHEILALDEDTYAERDVEHVRPLWDRRLHGMHTFNFEQGLTVIDVKYYRRRWF